MKNILFFNTTKLAVVLKRTLMVLTLCIISALCIQAEESTIEPSDSIAVTGPKKSHWTTKEYYLGFIPYTQYHHNIDYAQVIAKIQVFDGTEDITSTVGNVGTVSIDNPTTSGTIEINSTFDTNTKSAYIYWNCGIQGDDEKELEAAHKLTIELKVTDEEGDGYVFDRWEKQINNSASENLGGAVDIPLTQTCIIGGGGAGFTEYGTSQNQAYEDANNKRYTVTYIAKFVPRQTECKVTFEKARGGGEYTYKNGDDAATTATGQVVTLDGTTATTLTALTNEDYNFRAWYVSYDGGTTYDILSKTTPYTCTFEKDATIYAKFIPKDAALFIIKGEDTEYWNLNEACEKALSSSKVVLPKANGTLYPLVDGELCTNPEGKTITPYTIPSGVTLLIPYESTNIVNTNTPDFVKDGSTAPSKFRELKLTAGVSIEVNGSICVNAKLRDRQNSNGAQNGASGMINMQEGSTITLNSGANLYCWGIIYGEGEITANSGATVYESFQVNDYPGGSIMAPKIEIFGQGNPNGQYNEFINHRVFPIRIFCFPNIQSKLHIHYGATEKVATAFASLGLQKDIIFISKSEGLFTISSAGSFITKWYDINEDLQHFELRGEANLKSVQFTAGVSMFTADVNSAKYILPIPHNMRINLLPAKEGEKATVNITENLAIHPGAKILVNKNITVKIAENKALYVYDIDQWANNYTYAALAQNAEANKNNFSIIYGRKNKCSFLKKDLSDAVLEVAGSIEVNGALYTTESGADIKGVDGGKVIFATQPPQPLPTVYQFIQSNITYPEIPITSAQLHNGEEWYKDKEDEFKKEYLATAEVSASTTIQYANNHWGWMEIWKDHDGTLLNINNTCTKANNSSAYEHNVLPEGYTFIGWSTEASDTNQEVIHTAQYTFGPELDIVDADNTKNTLTINANGWASSGWPYTINGTEYGKDDKAGKEKYRQADRTLVIPYTGTSGASLPIAVLDKDGKPICRHIYKVPFVYTGTENMNAMNENSIVFVKNGTLTVGDASAKEIYVAPGAELKVNGTLTVGKLVLRTKPWQSAVLTNNGTINGQVYYSRISPDAKQYYQFGLPLSCALANVKMSNTGKLGGSQPKYGTAWMLKSYNEESRAKNGISNEGANWDLLPSEGTITAGVGYEMFSNSNYYREFYFPVNLSEATNQVSVQYTGGTKEEHNGWNIITSPLTSKATVTIGDPATAIKVCWLDEDGSYWQEVPTTVIPPAIPFSYQASAKGYLNFVSTIAAAPRKQSAAEALTETEWVHLDIFDAYGEGDETSLFVHPTRFEQTYKTGIDMAKQSLTASRAILYTTHAYGDMAFAGVADSLLENGIDLVVYSPSAQELTFSLRENKFLNRLEYLWLADNETGERTDLLMDEYTFRADAGTAKGRFVLNGRLKAPQISTGIGNTQTDYNIYAIGNNIAISGVEQGTPIYVFDAVGHMIYTTAATSDEVIVPAPCAGVYMLSVGGQTAKLVINQ